ncbi:MAG: CDP-diacylglycerol--glycerol-3-phosphate 3-phosphatidyltransferase [Pseudomonadota bacterium]
MPRNLPNSLTYGRIALIPLLAMTFYFPGDLADWLALAIFVTAGVTDFFDGYLARSMQQQSALGAMLDPIADKLLVGAAIIMLVYSRRIDGLNVISALIILCREILVSGLREFLAGLKVSVPVSKLAKWKTAGQMIALGFLLAGEAGDKVVPYNHGIGITGLWIAAILTLYTGYDYLRAGLRHASGPVIGLRS